jgi:lysophospholipase L1-like esterase
MPTSAGRRTQTTTLFTFGDSVTPGALLVRNDDGLFPEFQGRDLTSLLGPCELEHHAVDGARIPSLFNQVRMLISFGPAIALVTIGGNDLLGGLIRDDGPGIDAFERSLEKFAAELPIRPLFLGNVYDPTMGEDARNFLGVDPELARENFVRINAAIAGVAARHGHLVDLHSHFLTGSLDWFTMVIEPSLRGASEVRRCFLEAIERVMIG